MHKPIKGGFVNILAAVAMGSGKGKKAAKKLQRKPAKPEPPAAAPPQK